MDWLVNLLTDTNSIAHILVVYALVISVGMLLGQIKIFGISLGVTFILFVGLACGYAAIRPYYRLSEISVLSCLSSSLVYK